MSLIAYDINGEGTPIVLLHGYLENRNMWNASVKQLKNIGKCISIDLPGHGKSKANLSLSSLDDIAEQLHLLFLNLGLKRFHIIGHSLGGYVSLAYAKKYPEMIHSILMCHSTSNTDSAEKKAQRDRAIIAVGKLKKTYLNNSIPLLFIHNKKAFYEKTIINMIAEAAEMNAKTIQQYLLMMKNREDNTVFIKKTKIPIGYIIGKSDPLIKASILLEEASTANAHIYLLKNAGHMGHIEEEKKFIDSLYKFIDSQQNIE